MRAVKALVLGMGILIVVGIVILVFGMSNQTEKITLSNSLGDLVLNQGSSIVSFTAQADKLILHLNTTDGQGKIVILAADTGKVIGTIKP